MPKVSVIISTFNQEKFICDAVDSVLAQTYKDFELIVIDDGSTDNTKDILAKYNGKLKYVYKTNGGVSTARNLGIRLSRGAYLAFLDGDDFWLPEKLEKQVKAMEEGDAGLVYSRKYMVDVNGNFTGDIRPHYPARNLNDLLNDHHICMSVLVKKESVIKAGMFDESIFGAEDTDLWIRVAKNTKIHFILEPLIKYRVHSNNASHDLERKFHSHIHTFKTVLSDKEIKVSKVFKKRRLAEQYYLLSREQYYKGKYSSALRSLLRAWNNDVFFSRGFIKKSDRLRLKIKKILNPLIALFAYTLKALILKSKKAY